MNVWIYLTKKKKKHCTRPYSRGHQADSYKVANENIRRICNNNWICLFQFMVKHNVPFSEHNFTSIKVQFNNFIQFFSLLKLRSLHQIVRLERSRISFRFLWDAVCRSLWVFRWWIENHFGLWYRMYTISSPRSPKSIRYSLFLTHTLS